MDSEQLHQAILDLVSAPHYQPIKPGAIAKRLGVDDDAGREVKRAIKKLVREGRLSYGSSHLVRPASAHASDRVTGEFRRTSGGYGFVRPTGTLRSAGKTEDIYVAAKNSLDAASGDVVLVQVRQKHARPGRPGPEGVILEVIERETHRFVGTYFERAGLGIVQVDGKIFTDPILVGDPGAKGARSDDKVVLEMVRFPSHTHEGEGVILDVLGKRGDPGVDTLSIIHEFGLPGPFPEDVLESARGQADEFDESIGSGRRDLTGETIITIDPVDARDFDDAISLARTDGGHWKLGVHIADVSHFVRLKSPLDREARDRATSVYLPDEVIPMLPETISNNLASLQPDRVRYTLSATIEFTPDGARVDVEVHKAAIQSKRRFTYEEVDDFLADREKWREKLAPDVHRLLGEMHELAMILRGRRMKRGSLELTMPEVKVDLDRDGRVTGAHLVEHTISHQIIEEFMLAANEAVAQMLKDNELFFLRRVHAAPDPRKLLQLTEFVRELGFETESLESRFAIQELLREVHGTPQEHAVNYAVLRSMQKAVYSPEEEGHYALASECYCHFTSPIRRYPDLAVHRLLTALVRGKPPKQDLDEHFVLGEHCSQREQRAEQAERELTKVKLLNYMSQRIGEEMVGIITGVEEFGLFVQGVELPAEGLIHVSALSDDYYRFDRAAHTLSGHRTGNSYRLGDAVRVEVARVDIDRRELDFRLVGRIARASHGKPAKAGGSRAAGDRPDQKARRAGGKASAAARGSKPSGGGKKGAKQESRGKKRKRRG